MAEYLPLERSRWFEDQDGAMATTMREDEIVPVIINWSNQLLSGETVASVAYSDSGVTRTGTALATPQTTDYVTGIGETEITITTSLARKLQKVVRTYSETGGSSSDYA
jgi:hypothetical protein